jgi:hypothetical protein
MADVARRPTVGRVIDEKGSGMTLSRNTTIGIGFAATGLAAVALAVANFGGGENGGAGPYAFTLVLCLAVAVALFGWAIPRIERPARAGAITGVLGALSVAAFWSGLPFVLGPAAIVLGLHGRRRETNRAAATVAVVLGALATAGGIAALIFDQVSV